MKRSPQTRTPAEAWGQGRGTVLFRWCQPAKPEESSPAPADLQGLTTTKAAQRPVFVLRFRPELGNADPIRSVRALLKIALRRFRLRCISARQVRGRAS
jgi:hypothetical protein